jgi:xylulokinase
VKGIYRFETGIKVNEFRDLRANPRCLLESQLLSFRVKWARMLATGVLGTRKSGVNQTPPVPARLPATLMSLGLPFDPYDHTALPSRVIATGAAANFPSVSNLVGDIFNAAVFIPSTQVDSAQVSPHRNAPASGYPARASLGGAYVARWVWGREWGVGGLNVFEDEIRRLLGKRWIATQGTALRTNINGAASMTANLSLAPGSGANSGASTPFGHPGPRSSLAAVFKEEDEDAEMEMERNGRGMHLSPGQGVGGGYPGAQAPYMDPSSGRMRTLTSSSTSETLSSSASSGPGTAFTTPDLSLSSLGVPANGTSVTPTTPTPLTPVTPLPTSDAEYQIGLSKVADSDIDSFLTYAAIVPEYNRLENILIKGII